MVRVLEQVVDDPVHQFEQRRVVLSNGGERRTPAFGFADDRQPQRVERLHRDVPHRGATQSRLDAIDQFVARVACEGEQQQFIRAAVAPLDQPPRLRHHHRRLAAAGRRDHQVAVVVHAYGAALLVGKGTRLDAVQEWARPLELGGQEGFVALLADRLRLRQQRADAFERVEFRTARRPIRPAAGQCRRGGADIVQKRLEGTVAHVGIRPRQRPQASIDGLDRLCMRRQRLPPASETRIVDDGGQGSRFTSGQSGDFRVPGGSSNSDCAPAPAGSQLNRVDVGDGDPPHTERAGQAQRFARERARAGVRRSRNGEQDPR